MGTKEQERKPIPQASFICQGEYWTLAYDDRLIRLRDSKGLRQLALLLREAGREFYVLDLVARIGPGEIDPNGPRIEQEELAKLTVRSALGQDSGEALDAQAWDEYRQCLVELTEELEEAREFHNQGRYRPHRRRDRSARARIEGRLRSQRPESNSRIRGGTGTGQRHQEHRSCTRSDRGKA
jgi:hypothetical protein